MIEPEIDHRPQGFGSFAPPPGAAREPTGLAVARVTKGVGQALGKALCVDQDAALPDPLAALVERLQAGPLGQTSLKARRVA